MICFISLYKIVIVFKLQIVVTLGKMYDTFMLYLSTKKYFSFSLLISDFWTELMNINERYWFIVSSVHSSFSFQQNISKKPQ